MQRIVLCITSLRLEEKHRLVRIANDIQLNSLIQVIERILSKNNRNEDEFFELLVANTNKANNDKSYSSYFTEIIDILCYFKNYKQIIVNYKCKKVHCYGEKVEEDNTKEINESFCKICLEATEKWSK